jgi:hypothetical protein
MKLREGVVSLCQFQSSSSGQVWNSGMSQTGQISCKAKDVKILLKKIHRALRIMSDRAIFGLDSSAGTGFLFVAVSDTKRIRYESD